MAEKIKSINISPEMFKKDSSGGVKEVLSISHEHHSKLITAFAFGFINNLTLFATGILSAMVALLSTEYGASLYSKAYLLYMVSIISASLSICASYTTKYMVYKYTLEQFNWYKSAILDLSLGKDSISWPSPNGNLGASKVMLALATGLCVIALVAAFLMFVSNPPISKT